MIKNTDIEFKELDRKSGALPESTAKEVIAFANTGGGVLYIGIRDDGSVAGVDDPDAVMTRLSNTLHDAILPDVMPFVQIRCVEIRMSSFSPCFSFPYCRSPLVPTKTFWHQYQKLSFFKSFWY